MLGKSDFPNVSRNCFGRKVKNIAATKKELALFMVKDQMDAERSKESESHDNLSYE